MERIRVNSNEFWIKDASGNFKFNSVYNYLISDDNSTLKVGGTTAHQGLKILSGTTTTENLTQAGFTVSPQSLTFSFT